MSTTAGSADPAQTQDLSKLTVPQLKALCKDRKLTGYSKLGKAALLEKLGITGSTTIPPASLASAAATPPQPVHTVDPTPPAPTTSGIYADTGSSLSSPANDAFFEPCRNTAVTSLPPNPIQVGKSIGENDSPRTSVANLETASASRVSSGLNTPEAMSTLTPVAQVSSSSQKQRSSQASSSAPKKRPAPANSTVPSAGRAQKKAKSATSNLPKSVPRIQSTSEAPSQKSASSAVFKVPAVPQRKAPASLSLPPAQSPQGILPSLSQASKQSQTLAAPGKRFKPLMINIPNNMSGICPPSTSAPVKEQVSVPAVPCYLDFPSCPFSEPLKPLSMPPSLSQRKHVQRWAVILSGLAPAQRKICALISKTFRYAVYLSAGERLSQNFSGRRSALMRMQYSSVQMNMWPYLRYREQERAQWKRFFEATFLGHFYKGFAPIAARLWSSPDHGKQLTIAVRFVLTRLWFAICIGTSKPEWLCDIVVDAQEIIPGEIWTITIRPDSGTRKSNTESFYVLEETCEVIGRPETAKLEGVRPFSNDLPVRADWSQYIDKRIVPDGQRVRPLASLLAHLKWASQGEYERGISRHWLSRMAGKGNEGKAMRIVAERYVLACVVGNSVSGSWMSATQMAQDFAGLSERSLGGKTRQPQLNMFLPAHHHVESVHLSTADGRPLHPAVAVVQTLGREYFILKDNGMQIGCEEDGVSDVWRGILGCDYSGREVGMGTLRLAQLVDNIRKSS